MNSDEARADGAEHVIPQVSPTMTLDDGGTPIQSNPIQSNPIQSALNQGWVRLIRSNV